jgi:hypothetical protein
VRTNSGLHLRTGNWRQGRGEEVDFGGRNAGIGDGLNLRGKERNGKKGSQISGLGEGNFLYMLCPVLFGFAMASEGR